MTAIKKIIGDRVLIRRKPPESTGEIVAVPGQDTREQPFFATVVAVSGSLSEPIKPGDTVLCAAPRSQDRVGTLAVLWKGEPAELMSTLDVVGIVTTDGEPTMCGGDPIGSAVEMDTPTARKRYKDHLGGLGLGTLSP